MKKRMIWNGNVVANLEESGYLDNDKMLLQYVFLWKATSLLCVPNALLLLGSSSSLFV